MFVDRAIITIKAGDGGNGCCSFRREAYIPKGGPNGGDGGDGGNVVFVADPGERNLLDFLYTSRYSAEPGGFGKGKDMHGRNGRDCRIRVPLGTIVRIRSTGDLLADIHDVGQEVVVAKGGKGGRGNARFATSVNRAPREHEPGEKIEPLEVTLELKMVADIGLVGYPNAGKSTLISDISNAKPKTAPYPFTTLSPVVGVTEYEDYKKLLIADIPGLVDGAHANVGLGHAFLRHIERTTMLVYVLDMAGTDGRNPVDDLHALERELELYSEGLSDRAKLIVANKMDAPESPANLELLVKDVNKRLPIFPMSAAFDEDFAELKNILRDFLEKCPPPPDPTQTILAQQEEFEVLSADEVEEDEEDF